jgi:hypothetical protein
MGGRQSGRQGGIGIGADPMKYIDSVGGQITAMRKYITAQAHASSPLMNPPHVNNIENRSSVVTKMADQTKTEDTTQANDPELLFPVEAYAIYSFRMALIQYANNDTRIKITWSVPAGATMQWSHPYGLERSVGGFEILESNFPYPTYGQESFIFSGYVYTDATAGDVNLMWAQENATEYAILKAGSYLVWTRTA